MAETMVKHVYLFSALSAPIQPLQPRCLNPEQAEAVADVFYEIGRDLFQKNTYDIAAKWLERSLDVLSGPDVEISRPDAGELRLSVLSYLGRLKLH